MFFRSNIKVFCGYICKRMIWFKDGLIIFKNENVIKQTIIFKYLELII